MSKKWNKYKGEQPPDYTPTGMDEYMGLGRRLDFGDGYNKIAYICALASIAGSFVYKGLVHGMESSDIAMSCLSTGLAFLFSYMIAQELDPEPDRRWGAVVGGVLAAAAGAVLGDGNIMVSLWLLFTIRMFNRTSGDRHRILDNVLMIGIAGYLGSIGFWLFPMVTAAMYVLESQIKGGYFRSLYLAGISCVGMFFADRSTTFAIPVNYIYIMAMAVILFLPELRMAKLTKAKGDKSGKPISSTRLVCAQGTFIMNAVLLSIFHGEKMAQSMMPGLMAAMGCGIYLFVYLSQHKPKAK